MDVKHVSDERTAEHSSILGLEVCVCKVKFSMVGNISSKFGLTSIGRSVSGRYTARAHPLELQPELDMTRDPLKKILTML